MAHGAGGAHTEPLPAHACKAALNSCEALQEPARISRRPRRPWGSPASTVDCLQHMQFLHIVTTEAQ